MVELLHFLKENQSQMEATLLRLVEAESPSNHKDLVDRCGRALHNEFEQLIDGTVDVIEKKQVGNQYRFTYGSGSEQLLILGHYDTVWDQGALPIRKEDGKLYGPGAFDMKGGLTVSLWAMKALHAAGVTGNRKIVFVVTSDEEIGSHHSHELIKQEAKKSKMVLVPESSISPNGAVKTKRKGIGIFQLRVRGIPVHAGINPWDGASAIDELALQIADLKRLDNREQGISINIGKISGGTRNNVVAAYAEADIDVRFETKQQADMLEKALHNRPTFHERTTVEMLGEINRYPLERTQSVVDLYKQLNEIALEHGYELEEGQSGGGSDGNFTAGIGIPTIDGLGPIGDGAHAEHEHVVLENLPYRAALIAEMLKRNINK